jgi:chromosome segregation ATPase
MSIEQIVNALDIAIHKLPYMENLYQQAKDQAEKMQRTIQQLANDVAALERKLLLLDKIVFSSEQECKRAEQQVQELADKKDRIEKLIATMLSDENEDYTKLKAIVKENVKAILSDNKIVISTAFASLVQTLQNDPEMIKAIYNIYPLRTIMNNTKIIKIITITLRTTLKPISIHY